MRCATRPKADINALRDEFKATFATKTDLAVFKSELTIRIVVAQVATAMLLFAMLKVSRLGVCTAICGKASPRLIVSRASAILCAIPS